tara:strand:+ start:5671 stop:6678 length:1008 start_codon:yes stop_codon:yes gene_type:complete
MLRAFSHHLLPYAFSLLGLMGIYLGGPWMGLGVLVLFVIHPVLDHLLTKLLGEIEKLEHTPSDLSVYVYPIYQTIFLIWGIGKISMEPSITNQVLGAISLGMITGGFGITLSHELIHRPKKWEIGLGVLLLSQVSYSIFRIEHVFGHHRNVGTPKDCVSARLGENIYTFIPKAIIKSFVSAFEIEQARVNRKNLSLTNHRFFHYLIFQLMWMGLFYFLFGMTGLFLFLGQSLMAIILLECVDYIEHYGLRRKEVSPGTYEPVTEKHSWDTNFFVTNTSLFNLGKHAHHHRQAGVPYQKLRSSNEANQYQFGYSTAILITLVPPLWFKLIHPRIKV